MRRVSATVSWTGVHYDSSTQKWSALLYAWKREYILLDVRTRTAATYASTLYLTRAIHVWTSFPLSNVLRAGCGGHQLGRRFLDHYQIE